MKIIVRIAWILGLYLIILLLGILAGQYFNSQLEPAVFENPTISVRSYLDDFVRVRISCYWDDKSVQFIVIDEFNNVKHNSIQTISCRGYKEVDLQGQPQDYEPERSYRVEARFDNTSISSGYFYLLKDSKSSFIRKEVFSWFYFMIYQNRLARGSYSDDMRFMYMNTHSP